MASALRRTGVLVVRVWSESGEGRALRARLTRTLDVTNGRVVISTAATPEEIAAALQAWLDEFVTSGGDAVVTDA